MARDFTSGTLEHAGVHGAESTAAAPAALRRVSWGAIFAGTTVALVLGVTLNLLGLGIGAATVNPLQEQQPFSGLGTGAMIWMVVANLLALFAGGWVAGRMAGLPRRFDGALHGIVAWGLTTFVTLFFLASAAGRMIGGVVGLVGEGLQATGQGAAAVAQAIAPQEAQVEQLRTEARQSLSQLKDDPKVEELLQGLVRQDASARPALIALLAQRTDMSQEQARTTVDGWVARIDQLQGQAAQAVEQAGAAAARAVTTAAIWGFVGLLLGGIAAGAGGALGAPLRFTRGRRRRDVETTPRAERAPSAEAYPAGT